MELFGGATGDDPLYEAVSSGRRYSGQEHWLPFFHETLDTLLDYMDGAVVSFDNLVDDAVKSRFEQIKEHYLARTEGLETERFGAPPYKPVPPDQMFLNAAGWKKALAPHKVVRLTPFEMTEGAGVRPWRGRAGRSFAPERQNPDGNVFDAVVAHVKRVQSGAPARDRGGVDDGCARAARLAALRPRAQGANQGRRLHGRAGARSQRHGARGARPRARVRDA